MSKATYLFLLFITTLLCGCSVNRVNELENECESLRERNVDLLEEVNNLIEDCNNLNEKIAELNVLAEHLMEQINNDNITLGKIKSQQILLDSSLEYVTKSFLSSDLDYNTFTTLSGWMLAPHIDELEKIINERNRDCSYPIIVDWRTNGNDVKIDIKTPIYGPYGSILTPIPSRIFQ